MRTVAPRWTPDDYRQRPTEYDPLVAERILRRVENGEMLPAICATDRDMPLPGTFLRWVDLDSDLKKEYNLARQRGTEVNVDEAVVAAQSRNAAVGGNESRALMWHAERQWPEKYGPRAFVKTKEGEVEDGGVDYRAEVRRKIDLLAEKIASRPDVGGQEPSV